MKYLRTKKGKIAAASAAAAIAAVAAILIVTLGGEKGWRSISVSELFGRVSASNGNSSYDAYRDMKLFDGYSLETDSESWSRLVLDDEKYIKIEENSLATFEKLGGLGSDSTAIRLERGAMTNELTKPLGDDAQYVVNTPNAVLAVRGTYFRVEVSFSDTGEAFSDVYVYGGTVSCHRVMPDGTPVYEDVEIHAGYKARIKMDDIITVYVEEMIDEGADDVDPISISDIPDDDIVGMYDSSVRGHVLFMSTGQIWDEINKRGIDIGDHTSQYDGGVIPEYTVDSAAGTEPQPGEDTGNSGGSAPEVPVDIGGNGSQTDTSAVGTERTNSADPTDITGPTEVTETERTEPEELIPDVTDATSGTVNETSEIATGRVTGITSARNTESTKKDPGREEPVILTEEPDETASSETADETKEAPPHTEEAEKPQETSAATSATSATSGTSGTSATSTSSIPDSPQETTSATTRRNSGGGGGGVSVHTHIWETETEPSTCTKKGHRKIYCPDCGAIRESEELPLAEHTPVTKTTPATCTEAGKTVTSCSVCGVVIDTAEIPAKGHTPVTEITQPTADKEGRKLVYCSVCEIVISDEVLPKFTLDISGGDIVITSTGYSIGGAEEIPYTDRYVITQSASGGSITVESGAHEILLSDVRMTGEFSVKSGASVRLDCSGSCSIERGGKQTALSLGGSLEFGSGSLSLISGMPVSVDGELIVSGGSLAVGPCIFYGMEFNGGSYRQNGGSVTITQADGQNSTGISFNSGSFVVSGGSLDVTADTSLDLGTASSAVTGGCIRLDGNVPVFLSNGVDRVICREFTDYPADVLNVTRSDGTAYTYGVTSADTIGGKYYIWLPGLAIDSVNFPDDNFRDYVSTKFDTDSDGFLSDEECAAVTSITVGRGLASEAISTVKGVEYFTELESLRIHGLVNISSIDVSHNTKLKEFYFGQTAITDIDLSHNTELEKIYCGKLQITSIDISMLPKLNYFVCSGSALTQLDVSSNPALKTLTINSSQISSIDLSNNTVLEQFWCDNTPISSLDLEHNTALASLSCDNTSISSLDLRANTALTALSCENTSVSSLDLENNTAIKTLYCSNTSISSLNLKNNTALKWFSCSNTLISSLDLTENTALVNLNIDGCPMAYIDLTANTALTVFSAKGCSYPIPSNAVIFDMSMFEGIDPKKIKLVSGANLFDDSTCRFTGITDTVTYTYDCGGGHSATFTLPRTGDPVDNGVAITAENFPDEVFRNYVSANFDKDSDGFLSAEEIAAAETVNVSSAAITSLRGIENLTALKELWCDGTQITELDISSNTRLERLDCGGTKLTELNVNSNPGLVEIGIYNTDISRIDISRNPALECLNCRDTGLTELDLSGNPALTQLEISNTDVSGIDISENTGLEIVSCAGTRLAYIDVSGCDPDMLQLDCSNCAYPISSTATEFDMTTIPGIDISRITYTGDTASFDSATGVFSSITGNITYTYDCGNGLTADFTLTRTL